jgi:hypothetical protein
MAGPIQKVLAPSNIVYALILAVTLTIVILIAANGGFTFGEEVSQTFGYCPDGVTLPPGTACE